MIYYAAAGDVNSGITYLAAAVIAFVSGTGGWATLQLVINRRGRKAEAARQEAESEFQRAQAKKSEAERMVLLAEVERKAYTAAEASAERRYVAIERDYLRCNAGLDNLRNAVGPLIAAIDAIIGRAKPAGPGQDATLTVTEAETITVRNAVTEARRYLN